MKITYYIEVEKQLVQYTNSLKEAKKYGENHYKKFRIVKLIGQYKYEGMHARILEFKNGKYKEV